MTYVVDGGRVFRWRISLICLEDVVGGALAVVAPPLGAFGRVVGPFARTSRVGGVVLTAGPLVHAGQSHVTHQCRFCEIIQSNQHKITKCSILYSHTNLHQE